ncbi:MAG: DUF1062 domain-containing protein [Roseburia sp.]
MSYYRKIEYRILPTEEYKIVRMCAGCGEKQIFSSTGKFRVNANGSHLDVWLIYQCEKCKHTYNLPVYERVRPKRIPKAEYEAFLANDEVMARKCGTTKSLFQRSKAEIAWSLLEYELQPIDEAAENIGYDRIDVTLENPYEIPVREDKILAEILQLSRSQTKKLLKDEKITLEIVKEYAIIREKNILFGLREEVS